MCAPSKQFEVLFHTIHIHIHMDSCDRWGTARTKNRNRKNQLDVYSFPIKIGGIFAWVGAFAISTLPSTKSMMCACVARAAFTHIFAVILRTTNRTMFDFIGSQMVRECAINIEWRILCMHRPPLSHTHTHVRNQSLAINFSFECNVYAMTDTSIWSKEIFEQRYAVCSRTSRADTGQVAYFLAERPIKIPAVALLLLLLVGFTLVDRTESWVSMNEKRMNRCSIEVRWRAYHSINFN